MDNLNCDHIKRLITLTSDYIMRLSQFFKPKTLIKQNSLIKNDFTAWTFEEEFFILCKFIFVFDISCRFHQHFTRSFYAHRSQKSKKYS